MRADNDIMRSIQTGLGLEAGNIFGLRPSLVPNSE